jgi:hypothetical protein
MGNIIVPAVPYPDLPKLGEMIAPVQVPSLARKVLAQWIRPFEEALKAQLVVPLENYELGVQGMKTGQHNARRAWDLLTPDALPDTPGSSLVFQNKLTRGVTEQTETGREKAGVVYGLRISSPAMMVARMELGLFNEWQLQSGVAFSGALLPTGAIGTSRVDFLGVVKGQRREGYFRREDSWRVGVSQRVADMLEISGLHFEHERGEYIVGRHRLKPNAPSITHGMPFEVMYAED